MNRLDFERAWGALQASGIAVTRIDGERLVEGTITHQSGASPGLHILIDADRSEAAMDLLDECGIYAPMPVVDRREPVCPNCLHDLDPAATAACPACDQEFTWVNVDDALVDRQGMYCVACGHDLRLSRSDRCSECGESIFTQAHAPIADEILRPAASKRSWWNSCKVMAVVMAGAGLIAFGFQGAVFFGIFETQEMVSRGGVLIVAVVLLAWLFRRPCHKGRAR